MNHLSITIARKSFLKLKKVSIELDLQPIVQVQLESDTNLLHQVNQDQDLQHFTSDLNPQITSKQFQ